ncbi:hypothetical protein IFR08_10910 [Pseudomonas fluorescens]|uniref:hypothetical protein n=1 Tax=Pseudomonas fluorescens TaxID=294 RepID=UPI001781059A|nr:hypothetical protein [Pseudomonas fluorescens]MBD8099841.1 hypothetical protein [Pseudomonas fluorescens]MBD8774278.1 hypothetical protein [Pseudomonas fluorescens]MBD8781340.1 hypothetical protein [Pseudomonas fluorescens]MBD8796567.1 hypothetical protein [Pseudomonas fluorescens]
MISILQNEVERLRGASNELAAAVEQFLAAGGQIEEGPASGYIPKPITYSNQMPPAPKPFVQRRVEPVSERVPTKLEEQIEARKQRLAKVMELAPHHTQGEIATMIGVSRRSLLNMSREFSFTFKTSPRGRHGNPEHMKALADRDAKLAERIKAFMELGISRRKVCGKLGINTKMLARILANHAIDYPLSAPGGKRCAS